MPERRLVFSRLALAAFAVVMALPAPGSAADLSRYRAFRFGSDLATVAGQIGATPSQARVVYSRPALIQELNWSPQPLGPSSDTEAARDVVFAFYNGELYRITVTYDRYRTEGLTVDDMIAAVSATYGPATTTIPSIKPAQDRYADREQVVAEWQDPAYRFELMRVSYGPGFRLVGMLKRLEAPAGVAVTEAARLDREEAPQRDADRVAGEERADRARLEKARLANKPTFRP